MVPKVKETVQNNENLLYESPHKSTRSTQ